LSEVEEDPYTTELQLFVEEKGILFGPEALLESIDENVELPVIHLGLQSLLIFRLNNLGGLW
jgi:hypothetical protein